MMASTLLRCRSVIRRRPASSLVAASIASGAVCACYSEWNADRRDDEDGLSKIPRDHYDPNAIAAHWERRPVSIVRRLANVAGEILPVAGEYVLEFHLRPRLRSTLNLDDEDSALVADDTRELERDLSRKLRAALTNLGPTFVKVGQQLSIRPDLVSPVVLGELQRLCDAVPPFDDEVAMRVLAKELKSAAAASSRGDDDDEEENETVLGAEEVEATILKVFEDMPDLVASASLGQVYKATLRSNDDDNDSVDDVRDRTSGEVAIKIQRPDMLSTVSLDLFLLVSYGKMVDGLCSVLTNQIPYHETFLNGFANGAYMELNYVQEAENQTYFRNELHSRFHGGNNNNGGPSSVNGHKFNFPFLRGGRRGSNVVEKVIVPKVFDEFTTRRVLVSEWIDGIPLAQAPAEQIRELIPIGVELFLCQLLDIGRFHADPHPGNLYVTKSKIDGTTPTLCLLDFGLVAHVSEGARDNMTRAIVNLLQGDYDTLIAHDAKNLGFLPHDMDVTKLKPVLKTILKEGLLGAGSNLHDRRRNLMAISNELNEVFFQHPFSVPPFFALVTRGLGLLEGIALTGDPSFDIFQASYPYAKRRAIETFSVKDYGKISRNMISLRRTATELN